MRSPYILQLDRIHLLESWFSILSRELGRFIAAFNIMWYHSNIKASQKKKLQLRLSPEKFVICKISHFTSWCLTVRRELGNFVTVYYIITTRKLLRKPAVRAVFRKTCNLRKFVFYNF